MKKCSWIGPWSSIANMSTKHGPLLYDHDSSLLTVLGIGTIQIFHIMNQHWYRYYVYLCLLLFINMNRHLVDQPCTTIQSSPSCTAAKPPLGCGLIGSGPAQPAQVEVSLTTRSRVTEARSPVTHCSAQRRGSFWVVGSPLDRKLLLSKC